MANGLQSLQSAQQLAAIADIGLMKQATGTEGKFGILNLSVSGSARNRIARCPAATGFVAIGPDGCVYPCPAFYHAGQESTVTITTLDGKWQIAAGDAGATVISSNLVETTIEFTCKDGKSINLDLDLISWMNFTEYAVLAGHWMDTDCGDCDGADFTGDDDVNMPDLD